MENYVKLLFKHDAFEEESIESAWAKKKGEGYELNNILFYAKEYSLGDIIRAEEIEGELFATDLIEESGHSTIRILFSDVALVQPTRDTLKSKGCASELSNIDQLISVDIPPEVSYASIKHYLDEGLAKELWEYQEACISTKHREEMEE
jgi:hypothetical protein